MLRTGILIVLALASVSTGEDIIFDFELSVSDIQVSQWVDGDVVSIPGGSVPFDEGNPALQGVPYTFLIPAGTSVSEVRVDVNESVCLDGRYDIAPVNYCILSQPYTSTERSQVYLSPGVFPSEPVGSTLSGNRTGFRLGSFTLVPFRYSPLSGELSVITSATVTVVCSPDADASPVRLTQRQVEIAASGLAGIVSNPERLFDYSPDIRAESDGDPVWVVIGESSTESILQPLIDHRNLFTGESEFVSVEWIQSNYSGYDTPEKIRNYLKDQFYNHSLIYALIAGDYGETTRISHLTYGSSVLNNVIDHYYMDLDGTWDADGDHKYGETNDGMTYYSDLYVGRFSTDNANLLQYMVDKTVFYETQSPVGSWRTTAVLIGAGLWPPDYWGSFVCEDISDIIPSAWTVEKLYETLASHPNNQIDIINNGTSYVTPQGHGWYGGISWYDHEPLDILAISNYTQLDNIDKLAVFHSMACMSGEITSSGCLAERLMFSPLGGAVGVMFNSSYGWGTPPVRGPSEWLEVCFAEQLFENEVYEIGIAQAFAKDDIQALTSVPLIGWVTQENNLIGDPAVVFVSGQTGIEDGPEGLLPAPILSSPSPNPVSGSCSIAFDVPASGITSISVYDVSGRIVRDIDTRSLSGSTGDLVFDARDGSGNPLPSGCYSIVMVCPSGIASTNLIVVR